MVPDFPHRSLANAFVTLEPLSEVHREPLRAACAADPEIWEAVTAFLKIDRANAALEIGLTYYTPDARGGPVNPAAKRLLLGEAFDAGFGRVQFHVDEINARSRAAVLKLGATFEGIQRWDRIVWTGRRRSTAVYSVIAPEWPAVREGLDRRLAAFGPGA